MPFRIKINRSLCTGCPVDAITLIDEFEDQVWPQ
jgi:hypothetical protein